MRRGGVQQGDQKCFFANALPEWLFK
jgi:hypothetical protein